MTQETTKISLIGRRARILKKGVTEPILGRITGLPPDGSVIYRPHNPPGTPSHKVQPEIRIPGYQVLEVIPDPCTCALCEKEVNAVFSGGLCAECTRAAARSNLVTQKRGQGCERCDSTYAFRNPRARHNQYLCAACHMAAGSLPDAVKTSTAPVASCAGTPHYDPRHDWRKVRGNRRACARCFAKDYDGDNS